jgi:hypothetical protein
VLGGGSSGIGSSGIGVGYGGGDGFAVPSGGARERVRLVRILNPHGVGEWTGDWSDASSKWADLLFSPGKSQGGSQGELERPTGKNDGTFWMDYTHFIMGFSRVDVCFAHPASSTSSSWHASSLPATFPLAADKTSRLCAGAVVLSPPAASLVGNADDDDDDDEGGYGERGASSTATVHISALQPTKRGTWCRSDRKKRYTKGQR